MNYTEKYQVQERANGQWVIMSTWDDLDIAVQDMDFLARGNSGSWRVVRIMVVTVATISKA